MRILPSTCEVTKKDSGGIHADIRDFSTKIFGRQKGGNSC
jgi:hypothetical protein